MAMDEFCGVGSSTLNLGNTDYPVWIGGSHPPVWMGGPCAVESEAQIWLCAETMSNAGGMVLRGGAFKPRSHPRSFQGLGAPALRWLRQAADAHKLLVVTEVLGLTDLDLVLDSADIIQIGARNAQNYELLRAVGRQPKPVLLKRGAGCTVDEWLGSAEYVWRGGNQRVILCERGIRGFDPATRFVLDVSSLALVRQTYGLPVLADPSHATGLRELVRPAALAALAAGADGILFECHPSPESALSDARQQIAISDVPALIQAGNRIWAAR